jgi:hypothetical protein
LLFCLRAARKIAGEIIFGVQILSQCSRPGSSSPSGASGIAQSWRGFVVL